jgi:membrane fusion protein (multidrug efflux system)
MSAAGCLTLSLVMTWLLVVPPGYGADEATSSVLVTVALPLRGALPDLVVAYGTAVPAVNGSQTLSVLVEGQVVRLLVTAGEPVRTGQPLLEFQRSPAASNAHSQAASAVRLARTEQATLVRLLAQQLATRDQVAQADKAVSDAQSTLAAIEAQDGGVGNLVLKAPFNGIVSSLPVAQGERMPAGAPLAIVTREAGLVITVGIDPSLRKRIRGGESVHLRLLSGNEPDDATEFPGRVLRIDRVLNPRTRMVDADIQPLAPNADVLDGAAFRTEITTGDLNGWIAPRDSVLRDDQGAYVFQVADAKAVRVGVKLLGGSDRESVILGSIDPHKPLVTSGNYQLHDGDRVRLK